MTADPEPQQGQHNPWADLAFVASYERWVDPVTTAMARVAFDRSGVDCGSRVLDVGTGVGALALRAAERRCSVLAFDSSAPMVERANDRLAGFADARAVEMNAQAFDIGDNSFDAAFAIFSVTLMPHRDGSLREMVRVVRPGGIVCLLNWATPFGSPIFGITIEAMERLDLLPAGGMDHQVDPLAETDLLEAGCVDVVLEPIETACDIPPPSIFLSELGPMFAAIPGFNSLQPAQRADLQSTIAHEVDGAGPWNCEATLGIGRVPRQ